MYICKVVLHYTNIIMKVIIYHSAILPDAPPDELDVLDEAAFMEKVLVQLGYDVIKKPFPTDYAMLSKEVTEYSPEFIVNLVETILGDGRLIGMAPLLFDHLRVPYTGCNAQSTYFSTNKLIAKQIMLNAGIPSPAFIAAADSQNKTYPEGARYLWKSVWEHASFGMDELSMKTIDSVFDAKQKLLELGISKNDFFAEEYINGREFNISVLGGNKGPEVMPVAEIVFQDYPVEKLKVVGYRSKWDENSFEYNHTVRKFLAANEEPELQEKLRKLCIQCWNVFQCSGYVRVDFRVDEIGNPWVLELNTNPCISPDAGFMAATCKAGYSENEVIERIVQDTLKYKI